MISVELAMVLLQLHCTSPVLHAQRETVAQMCPLPEVQGPKLPDVVKLAEGKKKPVAKKTKKSKKKHRKRRRR